MKIDLNYYVDLRADFCRPSSIDEPSGAELAAILSEGLPQHGITVLKTEGMDFAHYVECKSGSSTIELMVGAELFGGANDRWSIQPSAKRSFFGRNKVPVSDYRVLLLAVNEVLHACPRISDVKWYPCFDTPEYLALTPHSSGPIPDANLEDRLHPLIRLDWQLARLTSGIAHPISIISFFIFVCILWLVTPEFGPLISSVIFLAALAFMTVVPFVLSILVAQKAKRISEDRG